MHRQAGRARHGHRLGADQAAQAVLARSPAMNSGEQAAHLNRFLGSEGKEHDGAIAEPTACRR
jgi:hypothetical protein